MSAEKFSVSLSLERDYRLIVDFGLAGVDDLLLDEPEPLGEAAGPGAAQLLASAVVGCLSASLLFCLRKAHIDVVDLVARVEGEKVRNAQGRLRIGQLRVVLEPVVTTEDAARIARCTQLFQQFCTVSDSVRQGIDIDVTVEPRVPSGSVLAHQPQ